MHFSFQVTYKILKMVLSILVRTSTFRNISGMLLLKITPRTADEALTYINCVPHIFMCRKNEMIPMCFLCVYVKENS